MPTPAAAWTAAAGLGLTVTGSCATVTLHPPAGGQPAGGWPAASQPAVHDPAAVLPSPSVAVALAAVGRALPGDVRVVVVRGSIWSALHTPDRDTLIGDSPARDTPASDTPASGDRSANPPPDALEGRLAEWQAGFAWLSARADLISIAAVDGPASGAGAHLALSCDLRILTDDAVLSLREPIRGLVPGLGSTAVLVALVGYPTALDLCLTGRPLSAAEAHAAGIAQRVVPRTRFDAAIDDLVAALLATPRDAAAETKALLRGALGGGRGDRDAALAAERAALARCLGDHPAG